MYACGHTNDDAGDSGVISTIVQCNAGQQVNYLAHFNCSIYNIAKIVVHISFLLGSNYYSLWRRNSSWTLARGTIVSFYRNIIKHWLNSLDFHCII
jgi:hypothetical protein